MPIPERFRALGGLRKAMTALTIARPCFCEKVDVVHIGAVREDFAAVPALLVLGGGNSTEDRQAV